ncbi:MAG: class I SAM-dependent methyltransferase [Gammaproteobacteria bacterium]|nr:class I SAM-dependent methyltransferase [Gammaproteobacteria bacterium]
MDKFKYADPIDVQDINECAFYHRIDLPGIGEVGTQWDLRDVIDDYLGNYDFAGKRVLDVGTASGFLTFSMEQRGAEVVSFDMVSGRQWDIVPFRDTWENMDEILENAHRGHARLKNAYWYSHKKLNSKAKVYYGDIYNFPDELGKFDVVVFGMILTHLREPFRALYSAGRLSTESIIVTNQTMKTDQPIATFVPSVENHEAQAWWALSDGCIERMMGVLGFEPQSRTTSNAQCIVAGRVGPELCTAIVGRIPRAQADIILQTAYHEAGHAVATVAFGGFSNEFGLTLEEVSDDNLGFATALLLMSKIDTDNLESDEERKFIEELIIISMTGAIAEQRSAPKYFDPKQAVDDHQFIADNLLRIVGNDKSDAEVSALRSQLQKRAEAFVDKNWNAIDQLAKALAAKTSLQGDEVIAIVKGAA